ncbi:hypothetical protein [Mesorhizobium marinum]|uniref:hypothetical protein n=1 Tax=Mesorhizobium marinum TaxID=3228790 RepID=UPI0034650EDF
MFDLIEKTIKVAANVVTLPVSAAADVVTLGGIINDRDEPYTVSKGKRIVRDTEDVVDKIAS